MEKSISADTDMETSYIGRYRYRYRYRNSIYSSLDVHFLKQIGPKDGQEPIQFSSWTTTMLKIYVSLPFLCVINRRTLPLSVTFLSLLCFSFVLFYICIWIDFKIISVDTDMAQNWPIYRYTDNRYEIETALPIIKLLF